MSLPTAGRWLPFAILSGLAAAALAQSTDSEDMRAALAPTGTLRAVFLETNPMQGRVDPQTGEVSGMVADLTGALGRRLGVPISILPLPGVPSVITAIRDGSADLGFIAYDATRAQEVAFTQPYILGQNSYIVRSDSPIRSLADADRAGVRIGSRDGVAVHLFLGRTLKNAELIALPRATTEADATGMLLADEIDAYAANTERLAMSAAVEPRVRVVDGSLMYAEQSLVVQLGNVAEVEYLNRFIDELRSSGFLQERVAQYAIAGVEVAPADTGAR